MTEAERRRLRRLQPVVSWRGVESPHGCLRTRRGGRPIRVSPGSNWRKAVRRVNAFRGRFTRRAAAERLHAVARRAAPRRRRRRGERERQAADGGRRCRRMRAAPEHRRSRVARTALPARVQARRARRTRGDRRGGLHCRAVLRLRGAVGSAGRTRERPADVDVRGLRCQAPPRTQRGDERRTAGRGGSCCRRIRQRSHRVGRPAAEPRERLLSR